MLSDAASVVGIVTATLIHGESCDDDLFRLEVLLHDGSTAQTFWDVHDWGYGRRVQALASISFKNDTLLIEVILDDQSVAKIHWAGAKMWSYLTRIPEPGSQSAQNLLPTVQ